MKNLNLSCQCGVIKGHIVGVKPDLGNRLKCYCHDCRRFMLIFPQGDRLIDEEGGTELVQFPLNHLTIVQGKEHLRCIKFSDRGIHRWYSDCCKKPLFISVGHKIPLTSVYKSFVIDEAYEEKVGAILGGVFKDSSLRPIQKKVGLNYSKMRIILRMICKISLWKLLGKGRSNCLYSQDGRAFVKPEVVADKLPSKVS